jgi:2-keto-4-pentenoate hydratase
MVAAQLLLDARIKRQRLVDLPEDLRPADQRQAYHCQERVIDRVIGHYGGETVGYKIACTNALAQELLKSPEPFYGRLLSSFFATSPACFRADDFFMRVIEAEFGFQFAHDLPPAAPPLSREQIADVLSGVLPSIEIVDSRYVTWTNVGVPSLIADNAVHGAWVRGQLIRNWTSLDLAAQAVNLYVNDKLVESGKGSAVMGHPLNALQWLVHRLHSQGTTIKAGEYVTTGVTTNIYMAQKGERVVADFGAVGKVEVSFD